MPSLVRHDSIRKNHYLSHPHMHFLFLYHQKKKLNYFFQENFCDCLNSYCHHTFILHCSKICRYAFQYEIGKLYMWKHYVENPAYWNQGEMIHMWDARRSFLHQVCWSGRKRTSNADLSLCFLPHARKNRTITIVFMIRIRNYTSTWY